MKHRRAWTFLALGEGRQFAGNTGYDDSLTSYYTYDTTVANHLRVAVDDLAVVRDSEHAIGMGWVEKIDSHETKKLRRRCPVCETTAIKRRKERRPHYRCDNSHEFDRPVEESLVVTSFKAVYEHSWQALGAMMPGSELQPLYVARAKQHAIRELDLSAFAAALQAKRLGLPVESYHVVK